MHLSAVTVVVPIVLPHFIKYVQQWDHAWVTLIKGGGKDGCWVSGQKSICIAPTAPCYLAHAYFIMFYVHLIIIPSIISDLLVAVPDVVRVAVTFSPSPPKCMQICTEPSPSSTVKDVWLRVGATIEWTETVWLGASGEKYQTFKPWFLWNWKH